MKTIVEIEENLFVDLKDVVCIAYDKKRTETFLSFKNGYECGTRMSKEDFIKLVSHWRRIKE